MSRGRVWSGLALAVEPGPPYDRLEGLVSGHSLPAVLAGKQLFTGNDDFEVFKKLSEANVPPLGEERDGLPASLIAIVHQALALEPDERFATAREFALALSKTLGGANCGRRPGATRAGRESSAGLAPRSRDHAAAHSGSP